MQETKTHLQELWQLWVGLMGLGDWELTLEYRYEDSGEWAMRAHTLWQYRIATISVNLPQVEDYTREELQAALIHELCHVLVAETREWGPEERYSSDQVDQLKKHEERVVVGLTTAFLRAYSSSSASSCPSA